MFFLFLKMMTSQGNLEYRVSTRYDWVFIFGTVCSIRLPARESRKENGSLVSCRKRRNVCSLLSLLTHRKLQHVDWQLFLALKLSTKLGPKTICLQL